MPLNSLLCQISTTASTNIRRIVQEQSWHKHESMLMLEDEEGAESTLLVLFIRLYSGRRGGSWRLPNPDMRKLSQAFVQIISGRSRGHVESNDGCMITYYERYKSLFRM